LQQLGREDEACRAYQAAIDSAQNHLELNPGDSRAYSLGAGSLARLGDKERAKQWTEQAMALAPEDPVMLYNAACQMAVLGESERALDVLERSIEAGVAVGEWIKNDPDFEDLRDHPRFQSIVKRIAPS